MAGRSLPHVTNMETSANMNAKQPTIIYTLTDEAPMLATHAFLPVIRAFADAADINVESTDISVAARILAEFSDLLPEDQRVPDNLGELGRLTQLPETNIIKLPNISASVPQLLAAIKELQGRATSSPTSPATRRRTKTKRYETATPSVSAARSTRSCARAIQIAGLRRPSRNMRASTRTA